MNEHPFRRFVLLCPQRSGSNALTSLLEQHDGVRLYGQLFNNGLEYRRYHRGDLDLPLFRPHPETTLHFGPAPPLAQRLEYLALRFVERERDLDSYLEAFFERWGASDGPGDPRAVGFKLHDFQLTDVDLVRLFDHHLDRIVILWRRNLLRSAVSWAVAMRTGVWTVKKGRDKAATRKKTIRKRRPVRLDLGQLAWFIDKTRRSVAAWERAAAASDTPSLTITFEDHVLPKELGPLLDHLGLDGDLDVDFGTRRLSSPRYEHVANAREIDRVLGSAETGFLFETRDDDRDA